MDGFGNICPKRDGSPHDGWVVRWENPIPTKEQQIASASFVPSTT
eukprot:CAMPEP_0171044592 /NCGR_PEP_ID=MMETSP0736-20130129/47933_1 /TAXON_ID=186038 /ORGANISM="Fragilariopsis kerguelensis, Strain L26-C5" /LENGTH=44 /DNA_ID= /DNA_START= /DNA_END= /DNA_ORIENTATION=